MAALRFVWVGGIQCDAKVAAYGEGARDKVAVN